MSARIARIDGIEVRTSEPSPQWTTVTFDGGAAQLSVDEDRLADLVVLLTGALEHVRKTNRQMGLDV